VVQVFGWGLEFVRGVWVCEGAALLLVGGDWWKVGGFSIAAVVFGGQVALDAV